ncbi:CPBP family intramembrane glutamic endopeptidase [Nocardia vermiculata]|uniref:CPBP family intramembrane glutamic endopeptidase n=1 Tax=Nocardia vermiculata TaxID=257274 RepID=UPI0008349583|nr:type II CAAX endopeptidase family protein [Nocardia vermiculata]
MTATASSVAAGRRNDLLLYLTIAFATSWGAWLVAIGLGGTPMSAPTVVPYLLGAFGPLIAALVVRTLRVRRGEPIPDRVVRTDRRTLLWAPLLLVLSAATVLGAGVLARAAGQPLPGLDDVTATMSESGGTAAFLVSMVISGPLSEEPGWRGTAYPRLRAALGRYQVCVLLGVIWAIWHVPLFFVHGTPQNELGIATPSGILFLVNAVPMAMLTGYAYEKAGVIAAMAVHFATNTTLVLLDVHDPVTSALALGIQGIVGVLLLRTLREQPPSRKLSPPAAERDENRDRMSAPAGRD